jgi:hypothetical protein
MMQAWFDWRVIRCLAVLSLKLTPGNGSFAAEATECQSVRLTTIASKLIFSGVTPSYPTSMNMINLLPLAALAILYSSSAHAFPPKCPPWAGDACNEPVIRPHPKCTGWPAPGCDPPAETNPYCSGKQLACGDRCVDPEQGCYIPPAPKPAPGADVDRCGYPIQSCKHYIECIHSWYVPDDCA